MHEFLDEIAARLERMMGEPEATDGMDRFQRIRFYLDEMEMLNDARDRHIINEILRGIREQKKQSKT